MQPYALIAVAVGVLLGFALGGRLHWLGERSFRWWLLLPVGLVLQILVEFDGVPAPFAVLLASYACLLLFVAANVRLTGMGVILVGIGLNALVIALNHGMPVRANAVRAAQVVDIGEPVIIDSVKHRLEEPDDRLVVLGDIIAVAPIQQVLSFGDLILSVGLVDLMVHLMRPDRRQLRGRRRWVPASAVPAVIDLRTPTPLPEGVTARAPVDSRRAHQPAPTG